MKIATQRKKEARRDREKLETKQLMGLRVPLSTLLRQTSLHGEVTCVNAIKLSMSPTCEDLCVKHNGEIRDWGVSIIAFPLWFTHVSESRVQ